MLVKLEGRRLSALLAVALAICTGSLPGCAGGEEVGERAPSSPPGEGTDPGSASGESPLESDLDRAFARAAGEFAVPVALLKAWGYAETRWEMIEGQEELPGLEPAWGLFGLRGDSLARAAELAGVEVAAVKSEVGAHLRAGAALLAALAAEEGVGADDDLGAWASAVALASGIGDREAQAEYVHDQVYAVINQGIVMESEAGLIGSIAPEAVEPDFPAPRRGVERAVVDFPGAIWRASPNFNSRNGSAVDMVIIHTCEGNYSGCWSWLTNPAAGASAHYVVSTTGEVSQLVRESNRAWHIAASYNCNLNSGVLCGRNGQSSNNFTVGIEHAGFASQSSFPAAQIDKSAALSCDISQAHGIPRDRFHFVAHGQLQPNNRTDPGPNWPWTSYIQKINTACGGGGGGGDEIIIDSNNANNDANLARMEVSASWTSAAASPGYFGSGYWFANTAPISDGAVFWFRLDQAGSRTIDAWWTSGTNRSASTPFVAFNASGANLGSVNRDQRTGGGQWNQLGTFNFSAGWNSVVVSRWTGAGAVVIADAIRVR
jgi:hypothetical protein